MASDLATATDTHHKLQGKWTLWAHLPHDSDWSLKSYINLFTVNTIEETIALVQVLPESLVKNCMLFLMRDGIKPAWEDPKNRNGGCFSYKVSNKDTVESWRDLSYSVVGETVSKNAAFVNNVCGITISPKKNFCIIKIWMGDCKYQDASIVNNNIHAIVPEGCIFKAHKPEY